MKIVIISDTHTKWDKLVIPKCDILISAGDYSFRGEPDVVQSFHEWLNKQDARHIVSVQGNHETWVENNFGLAKSIAQETCPRVNFIDEGLVELEGLKIWCSAITPAFGNWAWNRFQSEIGKHWDLIPNDTDVLVTHGPPENILDTVPYFDSKIGAMSVRHVGCPQLARKVFDIKPRTHIFGHIHESYGQYYQAGIQFINASICNENYKAVNKPVEIDV